MTDELFAEVVAKLLRSARLRSSNENALQQSIEEALIAGRVDFGREKALSARDRPDFLLADGRVVLEAKARYPKKAIYRQMVRYAEHDSVKVLMLVTGTAMGFPAEINGKPVIVIPVGMGSLGC